jgi:hypothetical protein
MKTTHKIRLFTISGLIVLIVAGINLEAYSQSRRGTNGGSTFSESSTKRQIIYDKRQQDVHRNDHKTKEIKNSPNVKNTSKSSTHKPSYKSPSDRNHSNHPTKSYSYKYNNSHRYQSDRNHSNSSKYYKYDSHNHSGNKYNSHTSYNHHYGNTHRNNYYYHQKYGKTYRSFHSNPLVFKHQNGSYHYYNGNFCQYKQGVGYVEISTPYHTVFSKLPFRVKRVRIHGHVYYTNGSMYFEKHNHGYCLVQAPHRSFISIRF